MTTFDYFLLSLPLAVWFVATGVGMDFAKEFCSVFRSVVYTRESSSARVLLKQSEKNTLLRIIKEKTDASMQEMQHRTVEFVPQKGRWWYLGGSATVLCKIGAVGGQESVSILLRVRYKQQFRVKPWLIVEIAAANTPS